MSQNRRKDLATIRRRVEDDGDEEGGPDVRILDDYSSSEDSAQEDDLNDPEDDASQISGCISPTLPQPGELLSRDRLEQQEPPDGKTLRKPSTGNGRVVSNSNSDLDIMLNGIRLSEKVKAVDGVHFDELGKDEKNLYSPSAVRSTTHVRQSFETPYERRRREHEEYRKKRSEDPAFVPNRGAFFMHDHRHSGPAANGFRPSGRGRGRGRLGSFGQNSTSHVHEITDAPWPHDMHDIIIEPVKKNSNQGFSQHKYYEHSRTTRNDLNQGYPQIKSNERSQATSIPSTVVPLSRALSVTKSLGTVQIRVALPSMLRPINISGISVKQYTRLPDHRPPLRRDKPVRVSLPDHPTRYIYPAVDRSFIFIPRALRPNQQGFGGRGRGRSAFGSGGGYSRRTSVFSGSVYGSVYSPSVAMSRRSSAAFDVNRETLSSPTSSAISRFQMGVVASKPIVRLPPPIQDSQPRQELSPPRHNSPISKQDTSSPIQKIDSNHEQQTSYSGHNDSIVTHKSDNGSQLLAPNSALSDSTSVDNQPKVTSIHQPKPPVSNSNVNVESPSRLQFKPHQQPQQQFPNQVPAQANVSNYSNDGTPNSRNTSYPIPTSTGTPLSQIPERAIHAQPFQPSPYQSQPQYYLQPYQVIPQTNTFYSQPTYNSTLPVSGNVPTFIQVQSQHSQPLPLPQTGQSENLPSQAGLIAQEVNGMVYYYDAAQIPSIATYPAYQQLPSYPMQQVNGMGMGVMAPNVDGVLYANTPQGIVYHL